MAYPRLTNLKRLRGDISLEKVAGDLEISVSQLSRYETGVRDPKLTDLRKLAAYLGTTISELIGEQTDVTEASDLALRDNDSIQVEVGLLRNLLCEALADAGLPLAQAQAYADGVLGLLAAQQASNVVVRLASRGAPGASVAALAVP